MISVEPTNVPCARCGAPMREQGTSHLSAAVTMTCGFCGTSEQLPADEQQRVLALRSLLVQRRWAEDGARGPALAYLKIMEGGGLFILPYVFGALIVVASVVSAGRATLFTAIPVGVVGGAGIATYFAYRLARTRLRTTLGPLLRSFPGSPGRPQRCRRCGGELPASPGAFAECLYCQAPNLSSHAVLVEHAAGIREQTADALLYGRETAEHVTAAGTFVSRAFMIAFVAGATAGTVLAAAATLCT